MPSIVIKNAFLDAYRKLPLNEKRFFLALVSKLDSKSTELTKDTEIIITRDDLRQVLPEHHDTDILITLIDEISSKLMTRTILYQTIHPGENLTNHEHVYLSNRKLDTVTGLLTVSLNEKIIPHLSNINKGEGQYLKQNSQYLKELKTDYELTLYSIFKEKHGQFKPYFTVPHLKYLLNIGDAYPQTYKFRRDVLDKAIKQINQVTDLKVSLKARKNGVHILGYEFSIKLKPKSKRLTATNNQVRQPQKSQHQKSTTSSGSLDELMAQQMVKQSNQVNK